MIELIVFLSAFLIAAVLAAGIIEYKSLNDKSKK